MLYKMLTDRILDHLASNTDIDMEHREIYAYSLERYISGIVDFITFSVLAVVLRIPAETAIFALFYGPLRKYAGGYHAKTRSRCMVLSIATLLSVVFLAKRIALMNYWGILSLITLVIAGLLIFLFAPTDSENRRLSEETKKQFRRKARLIFAADSLFLIFAVVYLETFKMYVLIGVLAVLLEGMILIPDKITFRQKYAQR
jgi:accessory gene regulator B